MKKVYLLAVATAFCSGVAFAENSMHQSTYSGTPMMVTVEQISTMPDDTDVMLRGYIVDSLGNERYVFQDNSGSITLEIDDEKWGDEMILTSDMVEIHGEIDSDGNVHTIDVDVVQKM